MSSGNAAQKTWNAAHVLFFAAFLGIVLGYGQFDKQSKIDTQMTIEQRKQDNQRKKEERLKAFMLKDCQDRKSRAQAEIAWRMKYSQKIKIIAFLDTKQTKLENQTLKRRIDTFKSVKLLPI
ncbi:hypothetical protein CAQ69_08465 [Stutzerimonas stutzeri]|nr:hypothetical protein CAQ69_08465 [Stutzerimonas stutzeri]